MNTPNMRYNPLGISNYRTVLLANALDSLHLDQLPSFLTLVTDEEEDEEDKKSKKKPKKKKKKEPTLRRGFIGGQLAA